MFKYATFEFDEETRAYLTIEKGWELPVFPSVQRTYIKVPGKDGELLESTEIDSRYIDVPVIIKASSFQEKEMIEEDLAKWLVRAEPKKLVFLKYPNREYMAVVEGDLKLGQSFKSTKGIIRFKVLESSKRGAGGQVSFVNGLATVNNYGNIKTPPVIDIDVLDDITHIDIISNDGVLRIGEAPEADVTVFEPLTKVLDLPLTSLNNWFVANLDNGYVGGNMQASAPKGMRPQTFGAAIIPHKYQGPAVRRSLPDPLQDLRIDIDVDLLNKAAQTGMLELYALDASSNVVFVIGIEDVKVGSDQVRGKFQVGGASNRLHQFFAEPSNVRAWNNFKGTLRIHRRGNRITPYWALIDADGNHVWKYSSHSYTDTLNRNMAPITQIAIAMRGWPTTTFADMAARNLKVYRYNAEPEGVPIIASLGDKFIVDMENSHVTLNGEDYPEIAFGSNFFDIPSGESTIMIEPSDKLSALMKYKERYR